MYLENGAMFDINPSGAYRLKSFGVTAPHWVDHGSFRSPQAAKAEAKRILESGEGAQRFARNPSITVRELFSRPGAKTRARYAERKRIARHELKEGRAHPYRSKKPFYHVQVRRKNAWISVAGFTDPSEFGKRRAVQWAKEYAERFPSKTVRVFWPDSPRKK
jgi:hypothetical protein